jgi:hypothetical protein
LIVSYGDEDSGACDVRKTRKNAQISLSRVFDLKKMAGVLPRPSEAAMP